MPADLENDMKQIGARLLAEAPPVTTDEVLRHTAERTTSITTIDPLITDVPLVTSVRSPRTAPRRRYAVVGTIAAASVFVVGLGFANRAGDSEPTAIGTSPAAPTTQATAAAATGSAVATELAWPPRLLLDDWFLVNVSEQSPDDGGMRFSGGEGQLQIEWFDDAAVASFTRAHADESEVTTASLLGTTVTVYRPNPTASADKPGEPTTGETIVIGNADTYLSAAIVSGDTTLRAFSDELDVEDFVAAIGSLQQVEQTEWEAALPADIVLPTERDAVVDEMTAAVPMPDGLDLSEVRGQAFVQPRSAIGYDVGRAITCAWLQQWAEATEHGEADAASLAADALSSVNSWRPWLESAAGATGLPQVLPDGTITMGLDGETFDQGLVDVWCSPGQG